MLVNIKEIFSNYRKKNFLIYLFDDNLSRTSSIDLSKNVGDLNLKLKMEIGALKAENEGLVKRSEEARVQVLNLEDMIQVAF